MGIIEPKQSIEKQSIIEIQMVNIGERLEILAKSISNLEDRLTPVCNKNTGTDKAVNPESNDKAASPMKDRLTNFVSTIDGLIYEVNSTIAELEI